jgi:type VI protein secretion system component VasK
MVEGDGDLVKAAGDGYFTEHLFKDVLMRDKDLAAFFQAGNKNPHRVRDLLLGVGMALLFLIAIGMVVSFIGNKALISSALERADRLDEITRTNAGKDATKRDAAARRVELEAAEELRKTVSELDGYNRGWPPLYLTFGLYSGNEINPYVRSMYFDSVGRDLFKPTIPAIEQDLRTFASKPSASDAAAASGDGKATSPSVQEGDLGRGYDLLKAYLMLSNPDRSEPAFLANQLADYWRRSAPADMELVAEEQLKFFARQASRDDAPGQRGQHRPIGPSRPCTIRRGRIRPSSCSRCSMRIAIRSSSSPGRNTAPTDWDGRSETPAIRWRSSTATGASRRDGGRWRGSGAGRSGSSWRRTSRLAGSTWPTSGTSSTTICRTHPKITFIGSAGPPA